MRVIAFRGESSLKKIAEKAYADLTPSSRKVAEKALLKANPMLKKLDKVAKGTLIKVPPTLDVRPKPKRNPLEDPEGSALNLVSDQLEKYQDRLSQRQGEYQDGIKRQMELLKSRTLARAMKDSPFLKELGTQAKESVAVQAKEAKAKHRRVGRAIKKLNESLSRG